MNETPALQQKDAGMSLPQRLGWLMAAAGHLLARLLKASGRLLKSIWMSPGDDKSSLDLFPELNVEKAAFNLRLTDLGEESGKKGEPAADSKELDEVERRIADKIENKKKAALGTLMEHLAVLNERAGSLGLDSVFDVIKTQTVATVSDFKAQVHSGRDTLYNKRRTLVELEVYHKRFREQHHLSRPAKNPGGAKQFFVISVLVMALLLETVLNGSFLAEGSIYGQLGGAIEAFTFAAVNIMSCFLLSFFGVRQIVRKDRIFYRFLGFVSLLAFFALAGALNLLLAHYREIAEIAAQSGRPIEQAGADVITNLLAEPLGLTRVKSWTLFGLGLLFSFVAFLDALFFDDPYPGYGALRRSIDAAHQDYIETKQGYIASLQNIREQAAEHMEESRRDLSMRRHEYSAILNSRSFLIQQFEEHMNHLERALNALLLCYRNANGEARQGGWPERFRQPHVFERPALPERRTKEWKDEDLGRSMDEVSAMQEDNIRRLHGEFDRAIEQYDQIDNLVPDGFTGGGGAPK